MSIDVTFKAHLDKFGRKIKQETRGVITDFKDMSSGVVASSNKMSGAVSGLTRVLGASVFGAAAAGAVMGLGRIVTGSLEAIDKVGKLSIRLGESTEFLSKMGFIAEQSGVKVETMHMAIQRANRRMAEFAKTGKGEAATAIQELGIQVTNADGKMRSFEELLPDLAVAFGEVEDAQEKTRLAMKLFDSEGVAFLQVLANGTKGLDALARKAEETGVVITDEMASKAADAVDAMDQLNKSFEAMGNTLAIHLAPAITSIATAITDLVNEVSSEGVSAFLKRWTLFGVAMASGNISGAIDALTLAMRDLKEEVPTEDSVSGDADALKDVANQTNQTAKETSAASLARKMTVMEIEASERKIIDLKTLGLAVGDQAVQQSKAILSQSARTRVEHQMTVNAVSRTMSLTAGLAQGMARAALEGGKFADELERAARAAAGRALSGLIGGVIGAGVGALTGGPAGAAAGFKTGFQLAGGFRDGGEFMIPGSYSSHDNTMVAFMGRPGERVSVTPPGVTNNNMTSSPNITLNVSAGSLDEEFVRSELGPMMEDIAKRYGMASFA